MGVWGSGGGGDEEVVKGLAAGGERRRSRCVCTRESVLVTGASASAVMPDHLSQHVSESTMNSPYD